MYFKGDDHEICSILYLYQLGGLVVTSDNELDDQYGDHAGSLEAFKNDLVLMTKKWDDKISCGTWKDWGSVHSKYVSKLVIQAVTSTGQEEQAEWLEALGFKSLGPFSKLKHHVTQLTFWVINGEEFCENIGYVCPYDPRNKEKLECAA